MKIGVWKSGGQKLAVAAVTAAGLTLSAGMALAGGNQGNASRPVPPVASKAVAQCKGCFAVVDASGLFVRGKGVNSVSRLGPGIYEILFSKPIFACAFESTLGLSGFSGTSPPGETAVVGRAGTINGVFLQTFTSIGAPADRGFHLTITCP